MITTRELVNLSNLKSLRFGIAEPARSDRLDIEPVVGNIDNLPAISWSWAASPCEAQCLTSCDANATANLIENKIFQEHQVHVTIDAERIYHAALERYHRNTTLLLGQSAETCYSLGLLTDTCTVRRIPSSFYDIYTHLKHGPIIVAHNISEGWRPDNLTEEGIIRDNWSAIPHSGHATLMIAFGYFKHDPYALLQNSWSDFPPMHGIQALSLSRFLREMIDDPVIINFSDSWKDSRGWEKFVIENPKYVEE